MPDLIRHPGVKGINCWLKAVILNPIRLLAKPGLRLGGRNDRTPNLPKKSDFYFKTVRFLFLNNSRKINLTQGAINVKLNISSKILNISLPC